MKCAGGLDTTVGKVANRPIDVKRTFIVDEADDFSIGKLPFAITHEPCLLAQVVAKITKARLAMR